MQIKTNKGIPIGENCGTLLNLLVGANMAQDLEQEYAKVMEFTQSKYNIDVITDLSLYNAPKGKRIWEKVLKTDCMAGTVPIYLSVDSRGVVDKNCLLENIAEQCESGVSIITIHPTPNYSLLDMSKKRLIRYTSRGGGIVINDMLLNQREYNIYLQVMDEVVEICNKFGVIISIGSSFRSATIFDGFDNTYIEELKIQIDIAKSIFSKGAYVVLETPGHVDSVKINAICKMLSEYSFPIMPLGPMPMDSGLENDDLVGAIGASLMGTRGCADILSIVTSKEHLGGIPDILCMKEAINKYNVAKHIIDIGKIADTRIDYEVTLKRKQLENCRIDGVNCDRCGGYCPVKNIGS